MRELVNVRLVRGGKLKAELLVVGCFQGRPPEVGELPQEAAEVVRAAARRRSFTGDERRHAYAGPAGEVGLVALHGLGMPEEFDDRKLSQWICRIGEAARQQGLRRIAVALPAHPLTRGEGAAERIVRELSLLGYRFDRYRQEEPTSELREVRLVPPPGEAAAYRSGAAIAQGVARGVAWARELGNTPPNEATPEWMAEQARALGEAWGMEVQVLGPEELADRRMGGILAVGGGSSHPPRLVRLEWGEGDRSIALVGKGVTFDTGGISIKPAKDMDEMKYDKSGACNVLGIARAAAELDLPLRFRAYLPLVENMPDGASYRPGDIVRCYNGKTVEITNTDAEGRMILADALAWAAEEGPGTLLEYSTLTGACVVALGQTGAGVFSPDDSLADQLLAAAGESGERLWRLPLWSEFGEEMKGVHADLKNSGGRWGGAATAAAFLANFMGGSKHWAHLDIAGAAYVGNDREGRQGATGYGVALTVNWLRRQV